MTFGEYQLDFADRVQRYFFNGGLLSPVVLSNRYRLLADSLEPAIVAESARWGDDNREPPYGLAEWIGERIDSHELPPAATAIVSRNCAPTVCIPVLARQYSASSAAPCRRFRAHDHAHTNAGGSIFLRLMVPIRAWPAPARWRPATHRPGPPMFHARPRPR
jgi:hypothetical protein